MTIRAKFRCESVTSHYYSPDVKTVRFTAMYDPSIPEVTT